MTPLHWVYSGPTIVLSSEYKQKRVQQAIYLQSATKLASTYPSRTFLEICRNYLLQKVEMKPKLSSPSTQCCAAV